VNGLYGFARDREIERDVMEATRRRVDSLPDHVNLQ
jgi:hypothetical protein